jgi:hypothetical protein
MKHPPNIHDILRDRLHQRAGLAMAQKSKFTAADLPKLERIQWSKAFEQLMRNRLLMGALRYGTIEEQRKEVTKGQQWDLVKALGAKIQCYQDTGNTEYLVDAANYCLLAFELDPHPTKHFHAADAHMDHCKRK